MAEPIPRAVLTEQLEAQLRGRRLRAGVFLTFEFDPGFFEQEILPVVFDLAASHARVVRVLQLEDALRSCAGRVAVYYDAERLVSGDSSAKLDVERIPVRLASGAFHPKNVLLLVEEPEPDPEGRTSAALLVGALSANLTRSGWWENVEAAHFEEIAEGEATSLKEGLQKLLRGLKTRCADGISHRAVDEILGFLRGVEQRTRRSSGGTLWPAFYPGGQSFAEFLSETVGDQLRGTCLEVISPYFDDARLCTPLVDLIRRFDLRDVRVMLPRTRDGKVGCSRAMFEAVKRLPQVRWGRLPAEVLRLGKGCSDEAGSRFVHAKLYRFFTVRPRRELCFVGSVNLTSAAHDGRRNWESGFLVEVACGTAPDFWLIPETARPKHFETAEEADAGDVGGTPLMLRYHWDQQRAEAFWDGKEPPTQLTLRARGVEVGRIESLQPRTWTDLAPGLAESLRAILEETSFVEVHGASERPGLLLVQEEGMSHKPSVLFQLTVAEILRYWALLNPAQRAAFLEARAGSLAGDREGAQLLARYTLGPTRETFFDRFAGYFHSFHGVEREVRQQLEAGRKEQAIYRLFGRKYDSLGTLLQRAVAENGLVDDVDRYVVFQCARQLCEQVEREFPDFWREHRDNVEQLQSDLAAVAGVRERLATRDATMPEFLQWFDDRFRKRASPVEERV